MKSILLRTSLLSLFFIQKLVFYLYFSSPSLPSAQTPWIISALPCSRHSATRCVICSRTSDLISPVSPAKSAMKPCERELMTSISCSVTMCVTSFRFTSSPSGHEIKRVYRRKIKQLHRREMSKRGKREKKILKRNESLFC